MKALLVDVLGMQIFVRIACLASVGIFLSGCGSSLSPATPDLAGGDLSQVSYSLYLNRASLTSQEFEQYKALPQGVFVECGTIHRGRSQVREQGIQNPELERQHRLKKLALEILQHFNLPDAPSIDKPGTGAGLADPGKFTLVVMNGPDKAEVRTSLDWVEQKQTPFSKKLHTFTRELRGVAPRTPCGNEEFYGIGRVAHQ